MIADVRRLDCAAARAAHAGDIVRLEARPTEALSVAAVGIDCRVMTVVPVEGNLPEPVYIEADPFAKAVALRGSDRPIELRVTDAFVMLVHGEYRVRLPRVKSAPFDWSIRPPDVWKDGAGVQAAIEKAAAIIPKDDQLGILLEWRDGHLLVASIKRSRHVHAVRLPCDGEGRFCMSRDAAIEIGRLGDLTGWGVSDGSLLFRSAESTIRVSPIRDGFPRVFDDVLADVGVMSVIVHTEALRAALKAVSVVLAKEDEHVTIASVEQLLDAKEMTVFEVTARSSMRDASATEKFLGSASAAVPWKGTCNIKDLIGSLAAVQGETAEMALGQKSILLRDGTFRALLALMVV